MSLSPVAVSPKLVKYELLEEIGHGGMATVYRARDLRLGREVAVKVIHPHLRDNAEVAARFVAEARTVAKLRHPGIVEVFDVSDEADKERYLVAELVRGPSLRKLLTDQQEIPPEIAACIGALLCDSLSHAHAAGIVHRDVKPENVLLQYEASSARASVKLTDFGIAKILDAKGVTSTGQVLGSPAHMAPEQIEGGRVDERTDVFSLGVLIYEAMTGLLPFDGTNPAQVLRKVLDGDFVPADRLRPTVGSSWANIVAKAIAKLPDERYPSASEFGIAIRAELKKAQIDDPEREIFHYVADVDVYLAEFIPRLIKLLIAGATVARENRQIQLAAAELNRAIAYAPDDSKLLTLVASLARGQRRQKLGRRLALVAAGLCTTTCLAVVARPLFRTRPASIPSASAIASTPLPDSSRIAPISSVHRISAASSNSNGLPIGLVRPKIVLPIKKAERFVIIRANPQSALVSVDQRPAIPVGFEQRMSLPVGSHTFVFSVPPDNKCCDSRTIVQEILDDGTDNPQTVHATLPFRPATVLLAGGPSDARMTCEMLNVRDLPSGTPAKVDMNGADRIVHCLLKGSDIAESQSDVRFTLRAGSVYQVRWPSPL